MQEVESPVEREGDEKKRHLFGHGQRVNPNGRPKGAVNKVTKTIREAVMEAVQPGACHPEGLAGWLIERARGSIEDRKIFSAVVSRALPIEVTGEGGGGIKLELSWLGGRNIRGEVIDVTPTAHQLDSPNEINALPAGVPDYESATPSDAPAAGSEPGRLEGDDLASEALESR